MNHHDQARRERVLLRYYLAVNSGDMDTACDILAAAEDDAVLQQQIVELEQALAEEAAGDLALARDRALVQELLDRHLSTEPDAPPPPLTVGQVVSRMQADRQVGTTDRDAVQALHASPAPLPARLSARVVRDLLDRLGARTSERFQRLFRDTAVLIGLAASQEQAAFARRQARATAPQSEPIATGDESAPPKGNPGADGEGTS
jgi:hypothetical protein